MDALTEHRLAAARPGAVRLSREPWPGVRAGAVALYRDLVSRIGTAPAADGQTFRAALGLRDGWCGWHGHPVAIRDCENDPTFDAIIAVLTIRAAATAAACRRIVLVGAPHGVRAALGDAWSVTEVSTRRSPGAVACARGLGSRAIFGAKWLAYRFLLGAVARRQRLAASVLFTGFWDWSFRTDGAAAVSDRYYGRLPDALTARHVPSAWLAWFEPGGSAWSSARRLAPQTRIVCADLWLRPREIVLAMLDFSTAWRYARLRRQPAVRDAFRIDGGDYFPLLAGPLIRGVLNGSVPRARLLARATERACRATGARLLLTFLEHFPVSRAMYAGAHRAGAEAWTIQHASYGHEKTFLVLDAAREFRGEPDGLPVPTPDRAYAMGRLGASLFRESGYPADRVRLTGSPRFDDVRGSDLLHRHAAGRRVLLLSSLYLRQELEMVAAVCEATTGMSRIRIRLRNHPQSSMEYQPGFHPYRARVEITSRSLEDDLADTDLVVFVYSTAAEEAYVRDVPVWQWLPRGFNGSALAEVVAIRQFASVAALREAFIRFVERGASGPEPAERSRVLGELFHAADGRAADRIADEVTAFMQRRDTWATAAAERRG